MSRPLAPPFALLMHSKWSCFSSKLALGGSFTAPLLSLLLFPGPLLLISAINGSQFGPNCLDAAQGIWRGSRINRFNYACWGGTLWTCWLFLFLHRGPDRLPALSVRKLTFKECLKEVPRYITALCGVDPSRFAPPPPANSTRIRALRSEHIQSSLITTITFVPG